MATIKDVAKLAESSITTVSRVLNNTGYVRQETREKILSAIKTLQYHPLERSNGSKDTKTIGLIVPNIENPFFGKMAKYLSNIANTFNYNILLFNIEERHNTTDEYLFDLINSRVDGLIYASSHKSMEVIQAAQSKNMPIIVLDREIKHTRISSVTVNNNYGAFIATEYLIRLGHRRIAYIGGAANMEISIRRKEGYLRALAENGLIVDDGLIVYGDYTMQSGFEQMARLYEVHPEITGVIAANDLMAIGAIHYLSKNGIRVAEDISVIGFDNIELSVNITPALTTVEYPMEQMSERVIELIVRQNRNEADRVEAVTLFPKLIVRDSCSVIKGVEA
jgi:DNA-binding LacI/PurR family transcriptional regulator